jgi:hypothetical protein
MGRGAAGVRSMEEDMDVRQAMVEGVVGERERMWAQWSAR